MNEYIPPRGYVLPEYIPPRPPGTEYPILRLNSHSFEPLLPVPTTYLPQIPFVVNWEERADRVLRHLLDTGLICECWFHNQPEANHYVYRVLVVGVAVLNRFKNTTLLVARLQTHPDPRSDGSAAFAWLPRIPKPALLPERIEPIGEERVLTGITVNPLTEETLRIAREALERHDQQHQPYPGGWDFEHETPIDYCYLCGQPWPCEAEQARHV